MRVADEEFLIFILPMILLIGAAIVGTAFALPPENTTDWVWGCNIYPDGYYSIDGYPTSDDGRNCGLDELIDDDLEEEEELEDEKIHEEESREYDKENN